MQRSRKNTSHSEEDDQPRQTDREAANIVEIANKDFKSYNCISDVPIQWLEWLY